jgi:hypothetical protein
VGRLRLTSAGQKVVATWTRTAEADDRLRIAEFLETLADGSWKRHWWHKPLLDDPAVIEVRPDEGLAVLMRVVVDEVDGAACADIITVLRSSD